MYIYIYIYINIYIYIFIYIYISKCTNSILTKRNYYFLQFESLLQLCISTYCRTKNGTS